MTTAPPTSSTSGPPSHCRNCHAPLSGRYCSACGQAADTPTIGTGFILRELRQTFVSFNTGFFYTVGRLITDPGVTLRRYLSGSRVKHMRPFSFLLLASGSYAFCYHYLNVNLFAEGDAAPSAHRINAWFLRNITWLQLGQLLLSASASVLVFGRRRINLPQFVIVNTYLTGFRMLIGIAFLPLHLIPLLRSLHAVTALSSIIGVLYLFLAYRELFPSLRPAALAIRVTAVYALMTVFAILAFFLWLAAFGPIG